MRQVLPQLSVLLFLYLNLASSNCLLQRPYIVRFIIFNRKRLLTKEAFTYALNKERYLRVFLDDGDVPIDNNASERAIRGFCIGKKHCHINAYL